MRYLWTEDTGAGAHYWQLVNQFVVESKGSNQGLLDAVRSLEPAKDDMYYLAFDLVYDNMDVVNKYLELQKLAKKYPRQIIILDMICFEYIIFSYRNLIEWTGTGKMDKVSMRNAILPVINNHKIELDGITDQKTREYLMGFKRYSTERVLKSITYELTENDEWSVKGEKMGRCWYADCCVAENVQKTKCHIDKNRIGKDKILQLLNDLETQRIVRDMKR